MIPKKLDDVGESDISALINNGVAEDRTIEYKRALPGTTDGDKKEFLADVSSFANSGGGDLIFGVEEDKGLPVAIVGLEVGDTDAQRRRLDSILAAGLSPRIRYAMTEVPTAAGTVLVIRVDRSWSGPHRVIFQAHDKFYGRNSAGKYSLDVNELRAAFNLSATVTDRIRAFRADRIIALNANETPMPFVTSPKIILHCIPVEAFGRESQNVDLLPFFRFPAKLQLIGTGPCDRRLNLEGLLTFSAGQPCYAYTQFYRTGIIEAVRGNLLLGRNVTGPKLIPSVSYEQQILRYLGYAFGALRELGCNAPVVVALTLTQTKGLRMATDQYGFHDSHEITSENIVLPETIVEDLSVSPGKVLKPMFDIIWNACGLLGTANFDEDGNWIKGQ